MFRLSDNYYNRKNYLERNDVPTQTVMRKTMTPALANVYFQSMTPKLKILAGLEPLLNGGGSDWYMPPNVLLKGRSVLKPLKKEYLAKLGYKGIDLLAKNIREAHIETIRKIERSVISENDANWKNTITDTVLQQQEDTARVEDKKNTIKIKRASEQFTALYRKSLTAIQDLLMDAGVKQIERVKEETYKRMLEEYKSRLKQQSTFLYDKYTQKLDADNASLKKEFLDNTKKSHEHTNQKLHDINVEKHTAIEMLRHLLECENLACQIYVALQEREECEKEMELSKHEHKKKLKVLKERMAMQGFELQLEIAKERKRQEFINIWKQKICRVVKKFQIFVRYCLLNLPEHADFFINMEKLMLLQLSEALENPNAENIFEPEVEFHTPGPQPHPFYIFRDNGLKSKPDPNLCPKHCTSSASQLPVIVVNKRFIYAACDNFDEYTDLVTQYIYGQRGDDADFEDRHNYQLDVPVKYTSSQQLLELKLESSLMQVLQQELPNVRELPLDCGKCENICICSPLAKSDVALKIEPTKQSSSMSLSTIPTTTTEKKIESRSEELKHEREPTWDQYLDYIRPRKCICSKTPKGYLREHIPPYMRVTSKFQPPELLNYEPCSIKTLRKLVNDASGKRTPTSEPKVESKTRDISTQYEDLEYNNICNCFSKDEISKLFKNFIYGSQKFDASATTDTKFNTVGGSMVPSYMSLTPSTFATGRFYSLRKLLDRDPTLVDIFSREQCQYD